MQQVPPPLIEVHDVRCQPFRMQAHPEDVRWRYQQPGCHQIGEHRQALVGVDQIPGTVDDHGGIRFVPAEHLTNGGANSGHGRSVQRCLRIDRRIPGSQQQPVPLP